MLVRRRPAHSPLIPIAGKVAIVRCKELVGPRDAIFHLLGSGLAKRQIARSLNLSVKTIESHRENIKRKLGAKSSRELVDRATRYVEETFLPPKKEFLSLSGKRKWCVSPQCDGGSL